MLKTRILITKTIERRAMDCHICKKDYTTNKEANECERKHGVSASFSDELLRSFHQHLLNKVNRVTSCHRHGRKVSDKDLTALCEAQIDFEKKLREQTRPTQKDMDEKFTI